METTRMTRRRWKRPRPAWVSFFVALACGTSAPAQPTVIPGLEVTTVASGLSAPTTMAFLAPDDILVLQKNDGQVRRVLAGTLQPTPVLDLDVNPISERGLLGIAVNSETPAKVFLYYTEADGGDGGAALANRVVRYDWNPSSGLLENPLPILDLPVSPGPNHDGGVLLLGPPHEVPGVGDGALLYVVIGDLNRDGQLENFENGAPPDDTGVILRVEQDGSPAPGNPFTPYCSATTSQTCTDSGDCPGGESCTTSVARYLAYGVRNSFGMGLDPETGALWDTENGPGTNDEINLVEPGFNSGWQDVMGPVSSPSGLFDMPGAGDTYSLPEFTWTDTNAPTAILFPSGSALGAGFDETALVADNNAGQIYAFPLNPARDGFDLTGPLADLVADDNGERDLLAIGGGFGAVTDLEIAPDGEVHVVSISQGAIYRLPEPGVAGLVAGGLLIALLPQKRRAPAIGRKVSR